MKTPLLRCSTNKPWSVHANEPGLLQYATSPLKTVLLFLFITICATGYAQGNSSEFSSAQEAIIWAKANKTAAAGITHITITGNNNEADLLNLSALNNNSGSGLFKALESIELSAQTGAIPPNCFYTHYTGAQWLKSFSAPNITAIGSWAFRFCSGLSAIDLPAVTSIGAFAFYNSGITNMHLPASVSYIGANPFLGCGKLTAITVDPGNTYFTVENGILYNSLKTMLIAYPSGKTETSFTSPGDVTCIGSNALGICSHLSEVKLPAVGSVRNWAFEFCTRLNTVNFGSSELIGFESNVFSGVTTTGIDLYLNAVGEEFKNNISGNNWKEYEWKKVENENTTRMQPVEKMAIYLYPNPVKDLLHIESNDAINNVSVYDLNAHIVLQTVLQTAGNSTNISLGTLPAGLYVVKVTTTSGVKMERVLKVN